MLTLKLITEETDRVVRGLEKKHFTGAKEAIDQVLAVDKTRRESQQQLDKNLNEQKQQSGQIGRLMKEGKREEAEAAKAKVAAVLGSGEMVMSVLSGNLTTICVFIPFLFFMSDLGFMGQMFKGIIFTIVIALASSLFVAIFLKAQIPSLHKAAFLRGHGQHIIHNLLMCHDPAMTGGADRVHTGAKLITGLYLAPRGVGGFHGFFRIQTVLDLRHSFRCPFHKVFLRAE